jgi:hypothetical protein
VLVTHTLYHSRHPERSSPPRSCLAGCTAPQQPCIRRTDTRPSCAAQAAAIALQAAAGTPPTPYAFLPRMQALDNPASFMGGETLGPRSEPTGAFLSSRNATCCNSRPASRPRLLLQASTEPPPDTANLNRRLVGLEPLQSQPRNPRPPRIRGPLLSARPSRNEPPNRSVASLDAAPQQPCIQRTDTRPPWCTTGAFS